MKVKSSLIALIAVFTVFTAKAQVYKLDTEKSTIEWIGRKVTGAHTGTLKFGSGSVNYNGALKGGNFIIDMTSIKTTDLQGEWAEKLEGHLKNEDFFATDKFATAKFVITKLGKANVEGVQNIVGNLTIKGITKELSFPATVKVNNGVLTATAKSVKIDRTKYDIKYGSKNFFDSLGDKAIDNDFELNISIVAKK
ncbi:YceI family protein [Pseudopedobacter beijingensis]|uniref:YceI family protein n=1 Tax=Pseudopedobacter beijingensis TaxID=1207056 RepID=A0ABW4I9B7_9SPHI